MHRLLFVFCSLMLLSTAASAQQLLNSEDPFFRMTFNEEKRALVQDFMDLSETDATAFWPIYNEYEQTRQQIGGARLKLAESYAKKYETLTDAQAEGFVSEAQRLRTEHRKLLEKYYKRMKKKTSPLVATKWLQMEEYFHTAIMWELYEEIPFVGEY